MSFITVHRERWGVEPVCKALQVAPSTYYAAVSCQPSVRRQHDEQLKTEIARVHRDNFGVYGIEKVWHQLNCVGRAKPNGHFGASRTRISDEVEH